MFAKDSMRKIKEKQKIYDYTREKLQNQLLVNLCNHSKNEDGHVVSINKSCAFGRI
jgi:hypothetical protein